MIKKILSIVLVGTIIISSLGRQATHYKMIEPISVIKIQEVFYVKPIAPVQVQQTIMIEEFFQPFGAKIQKEEYSQEDIDLLAKVIDLEACNRLGALTDEWSLAIIEVIMNRVASLEFPNTIYEVIYQSGQYQSSDTLFFKEHIGCEYCYDIVMRFIAGERVFNDLLVVYQSQSIQGGGICRIMSDDVFGTTYFCYTNYPEKYK